MSTTQPPRAEGQGVTLLGRAPAGPVDLAEVAVLLDPHDAVAIAKQPLLPRTVLRTAKRRGSRVADDPAGAQGRIARGAAGRRGPAVRANHRISPRRTSPRAIMFTATTSRSAKGSSSTTRRVLSTAPWTTYRRASAAPSWASAGRMAGSARATTSPSWPRSTARPRRRARSPTTSGNPGVIEEYPNVDGVIPLGTKGGCGAHYGSSDLGVFQRTMAGIVDHPNVGGYVILSLGCEVNQPTDMIESTGLGNGHQPTVLTIQQDGGFAKTVEAGIAAVKRILPVANQVQREPIPASELVVALAVRRLRRLVGRDRQPRSGPGRRRDRPGRHRRARRDDGGLRRRAPAHAAREERPGGPEADRPHPLVGELHRATSARRSTTTRRRATSSAG